MKKAPEPSGSGTAAFGKVMAKQEKPVEAKRPPVRSETPVPAGAKPTPSPEAVAQAETANLTLLGQATWLMSLSSAHKHFFLADLEWRIRPPLLLRQCRLFQRDGRPFAFVTWAYVTDEVIARLKTAPGRLQPAEWRCGRKPVVVDVIAPFGGADACLKEAQRVALKAVAAPSSRA